MSETMLSVENLTKSFGSVEAVRGLSFSVKRGEIFGFLGPNGAGKTTTMRMLTGFLPPTSGSFNLKGISASSEIELRKHIGYLPETTPLYGEMMVYEYLNYAGRLRGVSKRDLKGAVEKMIDICGLQKMRNRPIAFLSKGYKQRVGLAQAMIHNPDLLILDEPMSGLDPNQIIEIRKLIKRIGEEKTVIYCSHILGEVAQTCDRILIIKNGHSVISGTPEELTADNMGRFTYLCTLKGSEDRVNTLLNEIGAENIKLTPGENSVTVQCASFENLESFGESLFRVAVKYDLPLIELYQKKPTLEEVFTELTGGAQ